MHKLAALAVSFVLTIIVVQHVGTAGLSSLNSSKHRSAADAALTMK